jgi:hypothetical protein
MTEEKESAHNLLKSSFKMRKQMIVEGHLVCPAYIKSWTSKDIRDEVAKLSRGKGKCPDLEGNTVKERVRWCQAHFHKDDKEEKYEPCVYLIITLVGMQAALSNEQSPDDPTSLLHGLYGYFCNATRLKTTDQNYLKCQRNLVAVGLLYRIDCTGLISRLFKSCNSVFLFGNVRPALMTEDNIKEYMRCNGSSTDEDLSFKQLNIGLETIAQNAESNQNSSDGEEILSLLPPPSRKRSRENIADSPADNFFLHPTNTWQRLQLQLKDLADKNSLFFSVSLDADCSLTLTPRHSYKFDPSIFGTGIKEAVFGPPRNLLLLSEAAGNKTNVGPLPPSTFVENGPTTFGSVSSLPFTPSSVSVSPSTFPYFPPRAVSNDFPTRAVSNELFIREVINDLPTRATSNDLALILSTRQSEEKQQAPAQ